jgi:hypothetical protein
MIQSTGFKTRLDINLGFGSKVAKLLIVIYFGYLVLFAVPIHLHDGHGPGD